MPSKYARLIEAKDYYESEAIRHWGNPAKRLVFTALARMYERKARKQAIKEVLR